MSTMSIADLTRRVKEVEEVFEEVSAALQHDVNRHMSCMMKRRPHSFS
jgi:hypothetical protein